MIYNNKKTNTMELEITAEQFNEIQDEIIKLEEELSFVDKNDHWGKIGLRDHIEELKEILRTERIII